MNTTNVTDRRRHTRVDVNWPVVILTQRGAVVGEAKNVGVSGAFILCRTPLLPKEKLKLIIMAPNRHSQSISAEVAWSNPYGSESEEEIPPCGMGIRFTKIAAADREFIRQEVVKQLGAKISRTAENR
ncbi:MAG: PilZ domain-containing protein [Deltaproteobacteria bacterium]|nr:MAG: PilZ domain-containing protein [Deltaproteobacteria bacterium]